MKRALIVRPEAETDLSKAGRWYQQQAPDLGRRFLEEVDAALVRILANPMAYPRVRESIRRVLLRRFPYAVFYLVDSETVVVAAVIHAGRDPDLLKARSVSEP